MPKGLFSQCFCLLTNGETTIEQITDCLREPAFKVEDVTFCIWRRFTDPGWRRGPVEFPADGPDPDAWLLRHLPPLIVTAAEEAEKSWRASEPT